MFIWDKNRYNLFRWKSKWASFLATSKWNGHDVVHKNDSYHIVSILFVALYHISCSIPVMNLLIIKKKRIWNIFKTQNLKFFFICKPSKMTILFKKWIWLVVVLFALRFQILVQYSQNQYHLTELYCLSNTSPSIEAAPKLANLSFLLTKYIFYLLI